jgi:uncharacterized phage infection (PIP) family protein YhgE
MSKYADDIADIKAGMATLLERSEHTVDGLKKLNGTVTALDTRVDTNCTEITKLKERQSVIAGINTVLTLIAASIAAYLGVRN